MYVDHFDVLTEGVCHSRDHACVCRSTQAVVFTNCCMHTVDVKACVAYPSHTLQSVAW
jgi:hypothetical protein